MTVTGGYRQLSTQRCIITNLKVIHGYVPGALFGVFLQLTWTRLVERLTVVWDKERITSIGDLELAWRIASTQKSH